MKTQPTNQHREAIEAIQRIEAIQLMAGLDSWKSQKIDYQKSILESLGAQIVTEAKEIMARRNQEMKELAAEQAKVERKPLSEEQQELGNIYWF